MTLDEIEKLWQTRKSAMNVWHDRMHEMPTHSLIALVLEYMPLGTALSLLAEIDKDIKESQEDDNGTD